MPIDFEPLLAHLPVWLLVLFRIGGIFFLAPVFGSRAVPARIKVLWALGLSFCVYPMLLTPGTAAGALVAPMVGRELVLWALLPLAASELLIGVALGYGAGLPLFGLQIGGQVIDQQMGLGLAGIFNPELEEQNTVTGEFLYLLALVLFLIVGGHRVLLATLVGSFGHVPLGGFRADGHLLDLLLGMLMAMFELAVRVAAPLLCLFFLEIVAMGFVARTVPQINVLSVGFAIRILIGFGLLVGSLGVIASVYRDALWIALRRLMGFFAS